MKIKVSKKQREKNLKKAIEFLNEITKLKIAPSLIHGVGIFATRDLKEGEKVYADIIAYMFDVPYERFSELRPDVAERLLGHFPLVLKGSHFLYPTARMLAYCNHADEPNYDAVKDIMLKDVKEGDEITEDYRKIEGWQEVFPWLLDKTN